MSYLTNNDNIYKEGTRIAAKSAPGLELQIVRYFHRTYYCTIIGDPTQKQLTYFERELLPPSTFNRKKPGI